MKQASDETKEENEFTTLGHKVIGNYNKHAFEQNESLIPCVLVATNKHELEQNESLIPCVLVATGTFSPVHRMHIINMELSKQHIEQFGTFSPVHRMHIINMELSKQHIEQFNWRYRVVGGFISPTHDEYCSYKLGDLSIPAVHRIQMLSLALEDNDWI
eukprot:893804_1